MCYTGDYTEPEYQYSGCLDSKIDVRDYKLKSASVKQQYSYPDKAFFLRKMPKIKNQGSVGSCVAHAMSTILEYHDLKENKNTLSTNFIYGLQRKLFNDTTPGMKLTDACKIALDYGDMLETDCSGNDEVPHCYDIAEESLNHTDKVTIAKHYSIASYFKCNSPEEIKYAIYNYGPVLASIKWYKNYKIDSNGVLYGEETGDYGGHAIVVYGYNETGFLCQNSWGKNWAEDGRFIFPYTKSFKDARGIVDYNPSDDIKVPTRNKFIDIVYKVINFFLNLFKK